MAAVTGVITAMAGGVVDPANLVVAKNVHEMCTNFWGLDLTRWTQVGISDTESQHDDTRKTHKHALRKT